MCEENAREREREVEGRRRELGGVTGEARGSDWLPRAGFLCRLVEIKDQGLLGLAGNGANRVLVACLRHRTHGKNANLNNA